MEQGQLPKGTRLDHSLIMQGETTMQKPPSFPNSREMVVSLRPEEPVFCLRPHEIEHRARDFVKTFPGKTYYAVKCNDNPLVLKALHDGGVRHFDVASIAEVIQIHLTFPDADMAFMHPIKAPSMIRKSYFEYGVRDFAIDSLEELEKIRKETENTLDTVMIIRIEVESCDEAYDLGGKFGAKVEKAAELLKKAREYGHKVGLTFHVGSQCMIPEAYYEALKRTKAVMELAPGPLKVLDVGGGFPAQYENQKPPPLSDYIQAIERGIDALDLNPDCEIRGEPGRALVATGMSIVVRVDRRREQILHINDGYYGGLGELTRTEFQPEMEVIRIDENPASGVMEGFSLYGPTCDSVDFIPGPYKLPEDIRTGDWIEIFQQGAYTMSMRSTFNGYHASHLVQLEDETTA